MTGHPSALGELAICVLNVLVGISGFNRVHSKVSACRNLMFTAHEDLSTPTTSLRSTINANNGGE